MLPSASPALAHRSEIKERAKKVKAEKAQKKTVEATKTKVHLLLLIFFLRG